MPWYTEKLGPAPMYVYIIGGGVGLGAMVVRARKKAASVPATTPLDYSTGQDTPGLQPAVGGSIGLPNGAQTVMPSTVTPITTNNQWSIRAQQALMASGYDPTAASGALSKYLMGESLTTQENAIVQIALQQIGPAPTPPPAPREVPPTTTTSGPGTLPSYAGDPFGTTVPVGWKVVNGVLTKPTDWYGSFDPNLADSDFYTGNVKYAVKVTDPNSTLAQGPFNPNGTGQGIALPGIGYQYGNRGLYTVQAGDTWQSISVKYYGTEAAWRGIYNTNAGPLGVVGGQPPVGSQVVIPAVPVSESNY